MVSFSPLSRLSLFPFPFTLTRWISFFHVASFSPLSRLSVFLFSFRLTHWISFFHASHCCLDSLSLYLCFSFVAQFLPFYFCLFLLLSLYFLCLVTLLFPSPSLFFPLSFHFSLWSVSASLAPWAPQIALFHPPPQSRLSLWLLFNLLCQVPVIIRRDSFTAVVAAGKCDRWMNNGPTSCR